MARIRTIKPEFFKHSGLFDAEIDTGMPLRVAFSGLWTQCDREGRFRWRPRELKMDILPYDNVDFSIVLDALHAGGFVSRYSSDGIEYGYIPSWKKHQVINQREAKSAIPEPPSGNTETHVHAYARTCGEYNYAGVNVAPALRETVLARDGRRCRRCGATEDLTIDHIFPRSIGGNHALSNLRTLCRTCNSSRPVQGDALITDLAKDGLSLDDMQRTCMHMHARGERERERERERKGNHQLASKSVQNPAREVADVPPFAPPEDAVPQRKFPAEDDAARSQAGWLRSEIVKAYERVNSPNLPDTSRAETWIAKGFNPKICASVVAECLAKKPTIRSLSYFDGAIADAHEKRQTSLPGKPPPDPADQRRLMESSWRFALKEAAPNDLVDLVARNRKIPPEFVAKWRAEQQTGGTRGQAEAQANNR